MIRCLLDASVGLLDVGTGPVATVVGFEGLALIALVAGDDLTCLVPQGTIYSRGTFAVAVGLAAFVGLADPVGRGVLHLARL